MPSSKEVFSRNHSLTHSLNKFFVETYFQAGGSYMGRGEGVQLVCAVCVCLHRLPWAFAVLCVRGCVSEGCSSGEVLFGESPSEAVLC